MALRFATAPVEGLYRIGRWPDPLAYPPWEIATRKRNRFDDPGDRFRVLYAAEQRVACFVETLAPYRPDGALLATLHEVLPSSGGFDAPSAGIIPPDWPQDRLIGRLRLRQDQRWLDLRVSETVEAIRWEMALSLRDLGYADLDLSSLLSSDRRLTQAIAAWAYDQHFQGIAYTSRFGADLNCWAIFEGAEFDEVEIARVAADDADLIEAARRFMLTLSG